jgi:tetratricopeptide (TPR) repeat protein/two-component sensor histidine kinase
MLLCGFLQAQEYDTSVTNKNFKNSRDRREQFQIKVNIVDEKTGNEIRSAYVSVNGILFPYNFIREYYPIVAKKGDQLVVYHSTFETIYHRITSGEEIKIEIEDLDTDVVGSRVKKGYFEKNNTGSSQYFVNLDSANYYKKVDIEKSLSFIENILKENHTRGRNAATYRLLGDIYFEWKQFDLAITNYKNSLQYREDESTKLQLVKAAIIIENFTEAEKYLNDIQTSELGLFQRILVYESLGDIYLAQKKYNQATANYKKALTIAEENGITSKVTDLSSELADVSVAQGNIAKANRQFQNSIKLAEKEDPVRSLEEKNKVADYFNQTQQFDKEITLRKQALIETKKLNDSVLMVTDRIDDQTYQNESPVVGIKDATGFGYDIFSAINSISDNNYKIGRALVQKEDYESAIPFLEKSIKDAEKEDDLIVKKDATRKLSEVYENVGEYGKAYSAYRDYVNLVDTLYSRKEQEIEQAKRFSKRIAENQNRIASLEKERALSETKVNLAMKDQELFNARNQNQEYVIYSLLLGILGMVVFAILLFRSNKQQKLANNLLALKSMRSQMNPHFIFNALNSVNSFIATNDERNANRYLSEFSVLMRSVLENSDEDFIPFAKEIELLALYVKLEHNRFKEKFDYEINVDESIDLDEYSIPPMLLQPYIENAIWHGLRYKEDMGKLEINISKRDEDSITVVIQDDGVGRQKSQELKTKNQLKRKSKGMSTIKKRIEILNDMYQDRISVAVSDLHEDGTGTKVELLLKRNQP